MVLILGFRLLVNNYRYRSERHLDAVVHDMTTPRTKAAGNGLQLRENENLVTNRDALWL